MRALTKLPGYLFAGVVLLLFACDTDKPTKTISLEEISPKSEQKNAQKSEESQADTLQRLSNFYANDSASLAISSVALADSDNPFFLDRFSTDKVRYQLTDSTQSIFQYYSWTFKDSNACTEAFYNWLDQAGKNKGSVALRTGNLLSTQHELYIVSKQQIVQISGAQALQMKRWLLWYSGTPDFSPIQYIIYGQPKKKTKWLKYENNKLSIL